MWCLLRPRNWDGRQRARMNRCACVTKLHINFCSMACVDIIFELHRTNKQRNRPRDKSWVD